MKPTDINCDFTDLSTQKSLPTDNNGSIQGAVVAINDLSQISSFYNMNYSINSICESNQAIQNYPPPPAVQVFGPTLIGTVPVAFYPCPIYTCCNCQQVDYLPQPMPIPQKITVENAPTPPKCRNKLVPIAPNVQKCGLDILTDVATNERGGANYRIGARIRYEVCSTCNKTKPINHFTIKSSGERTHTCEVCSARKRNYYQRTCGIRRHRRYMNFK